MIAAATWTVTITDTNGVVIEDVHTGADRALAEVAALAEAEDAYTYGARGVIRLTAFSEVGRFLMERTYVPVAPAA